MSEAAYNKELSEHLADYYDDPYGYVMYNFPWEEPGTMLEHEPGPDVWQAELLEDLGNQIKKRAFTGRKSVMPIRASTVSGHGVGKSAFTSMIGKMILDTRPFSRGVITATKLDQLKNRTFPEIKKWNDMSLSGHLWKVGTSAGHLGVFNKAHPATWYASGETAKKENSEGFAGLHAKTSTPFYLFDEASGIPEEIFTVAQGGLTDGESWWLMFGNGTVNSGYFYRTQEGNLRDKWIRHRVDSRHTRFANKEYLDELVEIYGEDSDTVKVRVRGMFPSQSDRQFVSTAAVEAAMERKSDPVSTDVRVMGVDVARFGKNKTVIAFRHGRKIVRLLKRAKMDTQETGAWVMSEARNFKPHSINIDCDGIGGAVYDYLRAAGVDNIFACHGAPRSTGEMSKITYNRRTENWWMFREELPLLDLPSTDEDLKTDLISLEYDFQPTTGTILLESKDHADARGIASPDNGDAVVMCWARPIATIIQNKTYEPDYVYE